MEIIYKTNATLDMVAVAALYDDAGLRRPTDDLERIKRMYTNSNLVISAWNGEQLVGVARSLTDFSYCCYLSDLAVLKAYQKSGIGKQLVEATRQAIGPESMLLLLSAPGAMEYYPRIGMKTVENGFIFLREK
ncbi:MAG: GNAT family N-acetyltransferase [Lewinellaceae bacterium]|nr:GNAT family N-acetyltransferase [Lewinellaceae bacterium]